MFAKFAAALAFADPIALAGSGFRRNRIVGSRAAKSPLRRRARSCGAVAHLWIALTGLNRGVFWKTLQIVVLGWRETQYVVYTRFSTARAPMGAIRSKRVRIVHDGASEQPLDQ